MNVEGVLKRNEEDVCRQRVRAEAEETWRALMNMFPDSWTDDQTEMHLLKFFFMIKSNALIATVSSERFKCTKAGKGFVKVTSDKLHDCVLN